MDFSRKAEWLWSDFNSFISASKKFVGDFVDFILETNFMRYKFEFVHLLKEIS